MTTLFVTDLDGTLLGPDSKVSAESAGIISDLSRSGALVSVATARTPATVEPLLCDTLTAIPAIVMTGASMWDRTRKAYIDPVTIPHDVAGLLQRAFLSHGVNPFVYTLCDDSMMRVYHVEVLTDMEQRFYDERKSLRLKKFLFHESPDGLFSPGYARVGGGRVILMLGIGTTASVEALASSLRPDPRLSVSAYPDIFDPQVSYIEVFQAGVSKAASVLRLKEMVGADRLVVYGDHFNDLSMFAVADESVAVANARPEVLRAATRVIGPNTEPSVALDMQKSFECIAD